MLSLNDLKSYQDEPIYGIIPQLKEKKKCLVTVPMGWGKTVCILTALTSFFESQEVKKALVVGPKRVAMETWPDEVKAWAHLQGLKVSLVVGTEKQRKAALEAEADLYITNRENFPWLCQFLNPLDSPKKPVRTLNFPFDALVWDESSSLKEGKKKTGTGKWSRFGWMSRVAPGLKRLILMSGTPAPEGVEGFWAQVFLLDGGSRLGRYKSHFMNEYFKDWGRDYPDWQIKDGSFEIIMSKIYDLCVSLRPDAVLDLPPLLDFEVAFDLPPAVLKEYKKMEAQLILPSEKQGPQETVYAVNAAVLVNKLAQIATGQCYTEEGGVKVFHDERITELKALAEEGENMLVFYQYKHELTLLKQTFPQARVLDNRDRMAMSDWNAGGVRMLIAHPASAAHGLNLQHGGCVCVWYSLPDSLEQYQQANKRLHRPGQKNPVRLYHLLARATIDLLKLRRLRGKATASDHVLFDLKRRGYNRLSQAERDEVLEV